MRRFLLALLLSMLCAAPASAATKRWRGDAAAVAQINTVTPTAFNAAVYTITINLKSVTYTADGSATVAEITAGLTAAFNAATYPEFTEIAAVDSTTLVTLTADTAGLPFTQTSSATGGTATLVTATTTAATGPNHWSDANNWSPVNVPVAADDVIVEASTVDILYGLAQSAVTLTSLTVKQSYTGKIGLPQRNAAAYDEYRATYLAISATTVTIGQGDGTGSGRIRLDTGVNACTLNVLNTGAAIDSGVEALLWKGNNASNAANIFEGSVGLCALAGETGGVTNLRVNGGTVNCGSGLTITNKDQTGGTLTTNSNIGTLCTQNGGTHYHRNGTLASTKIDGGTLYYASPNNITLLDIGSAGTVDLSQDLRTLTCTTCNLYAGATLRDPQGRVTWTNGIDLERCSIDDVTIDVGSHKKLTVAAAT